MSFGYPITLLALLLFCIPAVLPKIPVPVKIAIQAVMGLGVYFGLKDAMFALPMGDSLPMSELFGGDGGMGSFNKYALGVIGPVLGIIVTVIAAVIGKLLFKKEE